MAVKRRRKAQARGEGTHKLTEEGSKEVKNFVKILIILLIGQAILKGTMNDEILPDDPWIAFLVDVLVPIYIALILIRWVNEEVKFFEETEWYKANKSSSGHAFVEQIFGIGSELTGYGKEIIKKLIKGGVIVVLFVYMTQKINSRGLVENDLSILVFTIHLYIAFTVFFFYSKKDAIIERSVASIDQSKQDQMQSTTINQTSDIFRSPAGTINQSSAIPSSKASTISQSSPIASSKGSTVNQYCKKCYGGLNEKGKCNQCDQKW
ncbi:MAG: hypothetical protein ACXAD7_13260 [Candidatus Kariarchaeaceae archaeon]|jgi:hypothetical protein